MDILIAADSFKDCMSAKKVGENLKRGLQKVSDSFNVKILPVADGGEGTVQSLVEATSGHIEKCAVKDALNREVEAFYGILGDGKTAIIEMAAASGIELIKPEERNPWLTTTFGTGQLIKNALEKGCERILIGIGGSATNDGGVGMATALGAKFFNSDGYEINFGGGALSEIDRIDLSGIDKRIISAEIIVACDVTNPLTGPEGASHVYGPQKGADEEMVLKLDANLKHLAQKIQDTTGEDVEYVPGAGAAGGLGAGLMAFAGGKLKRGFDIVAEEVELDSACKWADLVITGEGRVDSQTKYGKTPQGVADIAKKNGKKVIAVAGSLGQGYNELYDSGFDGILSIVDKPMTLDEALNNAGGLLENSGELIGRQIMMWQ